MNRSVQPVAVLAFVSLWACSPAPRSNGAQSTASPAPAPQAAAPRPAMPVPTKRYKMVCRNSQSGRPAPCGTPNAVMVGIKQD